MDDVSFNVIKAYKTVPIKEFETFIDCLKDDADDQREDTAFTPEYIMDKAENKYKILVNENSWDAKSSDKD